MRDFKSVGLLTVFAVGSLAMNFAVSTAGAQVVAVGPFVGSSTETFEEFPTQDVQLFLPNPLPVFDGAATMTIAGGFAAAAIYNPPTNPFGSFEPIDGSQFAVTQDFGDTVEIDFSSPATAFGGYFGQGNNNGALPATMSFYDSSDNLLGSGMFTPDSSSLVWSGFASSTPFSSVLITPDPGALLAMDSLQVTYVPEPATAGIVLLGLSSLAMRRRAARH